MKNILKVAGAQKWTLIKMVKSTERNSVDTLKLTEGVHEKNQLGINHIFKQFKRLKRGIPTACCFTAKHLQDKSKGLYQSEMQYILICLELSPSYLGVRS